MKKCYYSEINILRKSIFQVFKICLSKSIFQVFKICLSKTIFKVFKISKIYLNISIQILNKTVTHDKVYIFL